MELHDERHLEVSQGLRDVVSSTVPSFVRHMAAPSGPSGCEQMRHIQAALDSHPTVTIRVRNDGSGGNL
jgi:hypothetical protein